MTRQDALRLLEETLDMAPYTLTGDEALRDLKNWDSLSTLAFIAVVDKRLGRPIPGKLVARCRTVAELLALLDPPAERAA
jgi:acyl carrier protein